MKSLVSFHVLLAIVSLGLFGLPATAENSAAQDAGDLTRDIENLDEVVRQEHDGRSLLYLPVLEDPYEQRSWRFKVKIDQDWTGPIRIDLGFVDIGAGYIDATLSVANKSIAAGQRASYTRLNTGAERVASFSFLLPAAGTGEALLSVTGLQYPTYLSASKDDAPEVWTARIASIPQDVKPMAVLKRPMQFVTTAGIDVSGDFSALEASLRAMRETAPLAKVLGFTSIESYVTWKRLEPNKEGDFDFSFYDAITEMLRDYNLKWFPLLIVGSGYALPDWFMASEENQGFFCLEHGLSNPIQSIWAPTHARHVTRVLKAFGDHYGRSGILEGVRLGPSGNYGESQYPAGGNWGPRGEAMHIHIGWWAGDEHAHREFRAWAMRKYASLEALNAAWSTSYSTAEEIRCTLPETMRTRRHRADFTQWYTDSMTDWCEWWSIEARKYLPDTPIYQSAGGWGFREAGTDYSAQTASMVKVNGGIRLTNETDSYEQNFYATRLATTTARLYNIPLGFEPASGHTARGVVGRIYNTIACNGEHLFTYESNILRHPWSIEKWVKYLPLLDERRAPRLDVAVYYPETDNQVGDSAFRYLYAWGFNPRAAAVRRVVDVDYLDDRLIREGYLDRYKALVFAWGTSIEADVLERMDTWLKAGGQILYPSFPREPLTTVDGDGATFARWGKGDTGAGLFKRFRGDMEPVSLYGDFVRARLLENTALHPWTQAALRAERPEKVFLTVQEDGRVLVLNYNDVPATVSIPGLAPITVESYGIARSEPLP